MAQRELAKYKDQDLEDFSKPVRVYSDHELRDFHQKIQKFWDEPREVILEGGLSGTAQKFRHQDLHIAYGAAKKVLHRNKPVYLYNDRHKDFCVLWGQYEDWRKKQDWIAEKQTENLTSLAEGVNF